MHSLLQNDKLLYAPFSERNLFVGAVNSFVVSLPLVLTVRTRHPMDEGFYSSPAHASQHSNITHHTCTARRLPLTLVCV